MTIRKLGAAVEVVQAIVSPEQALLSQLAQAVVSKAKDEGIAQISEGVFLSTAENAIAEQALWGEEDEQKERDFSQSPYWLMTDSGAQPVAVSGPEDEELLGLLDVDSLVCQRDDDLATPEEVVAARQARYRRGM